MQLEPHPLADQELIAGMKDGGLLGLSASGALKATVSPFYIIYICNIYWIYYI